jgi:hypothetical protein
MMPQNISCAIGIKSMARPSHVDCALGLSFRYTQCLSRNAPIKPKSQSILSKIVALTPLKLTSDISRKLDRFPPNGYPLKAIALALSEKEYCGWNTSSED